MERDKFLSSQPPESPKLPEVSGNLKLFIIPTLTAAAAIATGHPELVVPGVMVTTTGEFAIIFIRNITRK